jgi:hypothetical protein
MITTNYFLTKTNTAIESTTSFKLNQQTDIYETKPTKKKDGLDIPRFSNVATWESS